MIQLLSNSLLGLLPMNALLAQTDFETSAPPHISPVVWICYFAVIILMIAAMWKVFSKAGQPGWAAIIPIYNLYIMCKIAGRPGWWVLLIFIPLVNFIVLIILYLRMAERFGKSDLFTVGLVILPFIFWPILGFGSAQYQGSAAVA